jgi:type I restriction enzyme S subunit
VTATWLGLRPDWTWHSVRELQDEGILLVEDGNHGEYRPRPNEFTDKGTAFIRAADLSDGQVVFLAAGQINDIALRRIRKGIGKPGDILFSHKGTVGKLAVADHDAPPFVCSPQTTFWRVADPERLDRRFLFAYMRAPEFQRQWTVRKGDTDMADYVSLTAQRTLLVPLPPLATQRKIAAIVSAYDDFIENNKRRIELLEEMAERLYREWFVDFRYPGHESLQVVESALGPMPLGWTVATLSSLATVAMGQSPPSSAYNRDKVGLPFHQGVGSYGAHFPAHEVYSTVGERLADDGDILVSVRAPVGRINLADRHLILGRGLCGIRAEGAPREFLLHALKYFFREEDVMGGGSIFQSVTKRDVEGLQLLWPGNTLAKGFAELTKPIWRLLQLLTLEGVNLRTTRDLLLPRLISGEIDVTNLNVATTEAAA